MSKPSNRPVCIHCGNVYGWRATSTAVLVWRKGEPKPAYRGNGIVTKEREYGQLSLIETALGRPKRDDDEYAFLEVWDGESWWKKHEPFCTLRCALDYARKAAREKRQWR